MQRLETKTRVRALQLLYAWDIAGRPPLEAVIERVAEVFETRPAGYARSAAHARAAITRCDAFDGRVASAALHWRLERVGVIERCILRLAQAELAEGVTPPRVVINEAVKLAQWFAGPKAPAFVNGVLDALARGAGAL